MNIGTVIYTLRTSDKISQGKLCNGLCSVATLSRIENGNDNIDRLLFESLIQRLGRSPDKYNYIAGKSEHQILDIRRQILDAYADENEQLAYDKLTDLNCKLKKNDTINRQFISKMRILLSYNQENSSSVLGNNVVLYEESATELLQTLQITIPGITIGQLNLHYLSIEELRIYFLIGSRYLHLKYIDVSTKIFMEIIKYIETRYHDKEEWLKLYPQAAYQLALQYKETAKYRKLLSICTKGINLLVENTCIHFLPELLHMKAMALKQLSNTKNEKQNEMRKQNFIKTKKQAECLDEIICECLLNENKNNGFFMYGYKQDRIRHVYLINEIIKRHRKLQNKSQEDLSKYIYTLEHMSRVETGNKTPNTRNFHLIMEELGMSSERYQSSIFTME